jgi:hypothetical protein
LVPADCIRDQWGLHHPLRREGDSPPEVVLNLIATET